MAFVLGKSTPYAVELTCVHRKLATDVHNGAEDTDRFRSIFFSTPFSLDFLLGVVEKVLATDASCIFLPPPRIEGGCHETKPFM